MRLSHIIAGTLALIGLVSTPAFASPCDKSTRVSFATDLGDATVSGIFTELETVSKQHYARRQKIRAHKCALMKMTGSKTWKAASKKLPEAAKAKPEVLERVRKLRNSIPPKAKYAALVTQAKTAQDKYEALAEINVPDEKSAAYLKNIENLRGYVSDITKTGKHLRGMRKRLTGIIKANAKPKE